MMKALGKIHHVIKSGEKEKREAAVVG